MLEYVKDNDIKSYSLLAVGGMGIINALIGTIQSFFNLAEKAQIHRNVAQSYNNLSEKLNRF